MKIKSIMGIGLMLALTGMTAGCGLDHSDPAPAVTTQQAAYGGNALQGPVNDGLVIAKKVGNTDFSKIENVSAGVPEDSVRTTTDGTGKFSFTKVPAYPHTLIMVAGSGKDALTNQPNIQMMAKSGSTYITPLTTLVATDTTGTVEAKLVALAGKPVGSSIGDVDTTNTTAAAMIVAKTVETVVAAMSATVSAATNATTPAQQAATTAQLSVVQSQTMQAIAAQVATVSVSTLQTPSTLLSAVMTPAITTAAGTVDTGAGNITIGNAGAIATAIATAAVDSSATVISGTTSVTGTTANTSTAVVAESDKINFNAAAGSAAATAVATITTKTNTAVTTASAPANITATAITTYTPPVIVVHTALAPAITSSVLTIPQSGSTTIVITFNHAIDTSVGTITVGGVALTPSYSADKTFATVTLASKPAAGATVAVVVSGYKAGSLTPAELAASYAAAMEPTSYAHTVPAGIVTGATGSSSINF